jgi:transcription initiation factor TFIIA large subunit
MVIGLVRKSRRCSKVPSVLNNLCKRVRTSNKKTTAASHIIRIRLLNDTWQAEYVRRKADIALNREENDRIIKDHVAASQRRLEGGGVLMPLDELGPLRRSKLGLALEDRGPSLPLIRAQGDATGDDDDEDDEDAINSDLDDPDELDDDAADADDSPDQVMLCTYDKVQRVKNKWKCTLKDGILRMQGSEVLFHKGSGEFEW